MLINLRRNYGHQVAIAVGINHANKIMNENDILVVMDSDGEDIPNTIPTLLDKLKFQKFEVAVAARKKSHETFIFKFFYFFYKYLFRVMTGKKILFGNFMALKYSAVQRIFFQRLANSSSSNHFSVSTANWALPNRPWSALQW